MARDGHALSGPAGGPPWGHVFSIDRLARNLQDLLRLLGQLTDKGVTVQFIESQVPADVLLALRELGIHVLPVHDSVIVGRSNKGKAREVMLSCLLRGTGVPGILGVVRE
ncbi:MAG: recombinase family protein [Humidesulfovibrio sp.]|uniref:recombinase family protein n=1 Tax=Humidesulfovibrio sp. TaxID=2910988 RepID=UPI002732B0A5|nr:recombinase family protein [Humidesulfovibrio sp.]MDP2847521.1 recombinase family protein [Humidesulfovibrio sp.]